MADYSEEITLALELVAEFGAACVWTTTTVGAANPSTPDIPGDVTTVDNDAFIALFPFDQTARQTFDLRDREITEGTFYGIMGAVDFIPSVADSVTIPDGTVVKVEAISPLDPAGTGPIIYTVLFML